MEFQEDFRELLGLLYSHGVEHLIVGAHTLAYHGAPRYTGDLDILLQPTPENAVRVMAALNDFGFGDVGLSLDDFSVPGKVIQLGFPPVRIDLLTSLTGITWKEAARGKIQGDYGGVPVFYLGREQFIRNKRALGRRKDLADLEALGEE